MIAASRNHVGYWAFLGHRLSGLALALFLPFHFLSLGLALDGEATLETFIRWTDQPLVKFAEWGLVVLLALHLCFGLRLLAIEFLAWRGGHKAMIGLGAGAALAVGAVFLLNLG